MFNFINRRANRRKKEMPLISVIISAYNADKYIAKAINSILMQTYANFELIIINDASTDETLRVTKSFTDGRIKIIDNSSNIGVAVSRNSAIKVARGKYIAIMDADDESVPSRFEKQVEYLEGHPEVGVCGSWIKIIGKSIPHIYDFPVTDDQIKAQMLFRCCIANPTVMMRAQLFTSEEFFYDENLASEDYSLWVNLLRVTNFYNIPEALLHYRVHGSQLTGNRQKILASTTLVMQRAMAGFGIVIDEDEIFALARANLRMLGSVQELRKVGDLIANIYRQNQKLGVFSDSCMHKAIEYIWYFYSRSGRSLGVSGYKMFACTARKYHYNYSLSRKLMLLLLFILPV